MGNTIDDKKLRNVAGAFATGISVTTVTKEDGEIYGMTVNSFLSVSLNPPLVAFSVRRQGTMMSYLKEGKPVGISILSENQKAISNQFAGRNDRPMEIQFDKHLCGVSTIKNSLAWYSTEIQKIILAGDHYIILCLVNDLNRSKDDSPLIYYSGYKSLA